MSTYTLPDLRYDYGALEPHISGKIMELHHDKHHAAYVKGANKALDKLAEARAKEDFTRIAALEKALAFNVSGHVLHSLFWQNMTPEGRRRARGRAGRGDRPRLRQLRAVQASARRGRLDDHGLGLGRRSSGSRSPASC